jgi:hypothetical protein
MEGLPQNHGRRPCFTCFKGRSTLPWFVPCPMTFPRRPFIFLSLGILFWSGCRTPQVVTQLERENYALENKIWELVDLLEQKQAELDACRSELERLKTQTSQETRPAKQTRSIPDVTAPLWTHSSGRTIEAAPHVADSDVPRHIVTPPKIEITPPQVETTPEAAFPSRPPSDSLPRVSSCPIEPPLWLSPQDTSQPSPPQVLPPSSENHAAPLVNSPHETAEDLSPAPRVGAPSPSPSLPRPEIAGHEPDRLVLPEDHATGRDYDGLPGDDGIALLLQPVDARGTVVFQPATVTVVAIDPQVRGPAGRIARWELQPEELRSYLVNRPEVQGFLLELPWPDAPPQHDHLKVFVRYETASGKRLESQADVTVRLAHQ